MCREGKRKKRKMSSHPLTKIRSCRDTSFIKSARKWLHRVEERDADDGVRGKPCRWQVVVEKATMQMTGSCGNILLVVTKGLEG